MIDENFIKIYEKSFKENWSLPALTDYNSRETFTYGDMARQIARIHLLLRHCQIRRGDKIALIGRNTPRWVMAFFASVTYGAIIVPILQDFNPNDVHHIINHSADSAAGTFFCVNTQSTVLRTIYSSRIDVSSECVEHIHISKPDQVKNACFAVFCHFNQTVDIGQTEESADMFSSGHRFQSCDHNGIFCL